MTEDRDDRERDDETGATPVSGTSQGVSAPPCDLMGGTSPARRFYANLSDL